MVRPLLLVALCACSIAVLHAASPSSESTFLCSTQQTTVQTVSAYMMKSTKTKATDQEQEQESEQEGAEEQPEEGGDEAPTKGGTDDQEQGDEGDQSSSSGKKARRQNSVARTYRKLKGGVQKGHSTARHGVQIADKQSMAVASKAHHATKAGVSLAAEGVTEVGKDLYKGAKALDKDAFDGLVGVSGNIAHGVRAGAGDVYLAGRAAVLGSKAAGQQVVKDGMRAGKYVAKTARRTVPTNMLHRTHKGGVQKKTKKSSCAFKFGKKKKACLAALEQEDQSGGQEEQGQEEGQEQGGAQEQGQEGGEEEEEGADKENDAPAKKFDVEPELDEANEADANEADQEEGQSDPSDAHQRAEQDDAGVSQPPAEESWFQRTIVDNMPKWMRLHHANPDRTAGPVAKLQTPASAPQQASLTSGPTGGLKSPLGGGGAGLPPADFDDLSVPNNGLGRAAGDSAEEDSQEAEAAEATELDQDEEEQDEESSADVDSAAEFAMQPAAAAAPESSQLRANHQSDIDACWKHVQQIDSQSSYYEARRALHHTATQRFETPSADAKLLNRQQEVTRFDRLALQQGMLWNWFNHATNRAARFALHEAEECRKLQSIYDRLREA